MTGIFLEISIDAKEAEAVGIMDRYAIDKLLDQELSAAGLGYISGGGRGFGALTLDVEIEDEAQLDEALTLIRRVLKQAGVPASTTIRRSEPVEKIYTL